MKLVKIKKCFIMLLVLLILSFLLGGCNLIGGASGEGVQELLQPPSPHGENAEIKQALEKKHE